MFSLKDLLELLDRWPEWKRLRSTPENLEKLETRVAELERRLARCPDESCPRCRELSWHVETSETDHTFGEGVNIQTWKCRACGFEEKRHSH
jgi:ribosomal protein L37E